jgi:hypothetical protein
MAPRETSDRVLGTEGLRVDSLSVIEESADWAAPKGMLLAKGLSGIERVRQFHDP